MQQIQNRITTRPFIGLEFRSQGLEQDDSQALASLDKRKG